MQFEGGAKRMRRRSFCKLLAGGAAAAALLVKTGSARAAAVPGDFNRLNQSYADFCAMPQTERVFYALRGNDIVQ